MAYDEALATRIRAQLAGSAGVSEKRMFGGLAFLKNGNMFVGVTGDELMARVGKETMRTPSPASTSERWISLASRSLAMSSSARKG